MFYRIIAEYLEDKQDKTAVSQGSTRIPSVGYINNFRLRHKDQLSFRLIQFVETNRIKSPNREKINLFFEFYEEALKETNLDPTIENERRQLAQIVFNCDEIGIALVPNHIQVLCARDDRDIFSNAGKHEDAFSTILCCGNANGDIISPLIIYKNLTQEIPSEYKSWEGPKEIIYSWFTEDFIPQAKALRPEGYE